MSAAAECKPKLRWLMRRIFELRPSRRPLERPRRMAARMPSRWRRRVRASATNGRESGARGPGQPGVQMRWCAARGRRGGRAAAALRAAGRRGRARCWPAGPRRACASWPTRLAFGRFEQRPAGALDPAAGRGVRALVGVPFVAADLVGRAAARVGTTWKGSKQISAGGIAAWMARWYSPLMSIETARIEPLRSPSSEKKPCKVALLRPGAHHTIAPVAWSATDVR